MRTLQKKYSDFKIDNILENASVGVVFCSERGDFLYANKAFCNLVKFSQDEILQKNFREITPVEDLSKDYDFLTRLVRNEIDFYHLEKRYYSKDKDVIWVDLNVTCSRTDDGKLDYFIAIINKITPSKKHEPQKIDTEEHFRVAFLTSPDSININRLSDGLYLDINDGFTNLTGWTREDVIGKTSYDINIWVNPEDRKRLVAGLLKYGYYSNLEAEFQTKNNGIKTCLMSASVIRIEDEICILSITRDISERKQAERLIYEKNQEIESKNKEYQQLNNELKDSYHEIKTINEELLKAKDKAEESDMLKTAFLANMSHEIRTPINAINGFADLLCQEDVSEEMRIEYSKIIQQRSQDLLYIIMSILDISKIDSGQMELIETQTNINDIFIETHCFLEELLECRQDKNIEIVCSNSLLPEQNNILIDNSRLKQVLFNLCNNSVKFTQNGTIEFGCVLQNDKLLFWVKDTGIGIPDDKSSIIFERFRQVEEKYLSRNFSGGTGLGLAISKSLVELMNGEIWFESELNLGTSFYFMIPYRPLVAANQAKNAKITATYQWSHKTVLLIEDDKYNADFMKELLAKTQINILHAPTAGNAISIFENTTNIDLILMDIRLPDMNGFDLTRKMKSQRKHIPIIAQTAYADESDKQRAVESGCDDFITKPIRKDNLLTLMQKFLGV